MARNFPCDVNSQAALTDRYRREENAGFAAYLRFKKMGILNTRSTAVDVARKRIMEVPKMDEEMRLKMEALAARNFRMCKPNPDVELYKQLRDHKPTVLPDMYPATAEELALLTEGVSKEELGRYAYLRKRKEKDPEVKFRYPILSSWDYGWRLSDVIKKEDIKKPKYGCVNQIETNFYSRNGIPYTRAPDLPDMKRVPY